MNKIKTEYVKLKDLKMYENNARKHQSEDVASIKASIEEFGFCDPIGIWGKENIIVEGHGRYLACLDMGIEEVPCIRLDHLTDDQRKAYAIAHNKTAENSEWDWDILKTELSELQSNGFDILITGFGEMELAKFEDTEEEETENFEPKVPSEAKTKKGDIYQLGQHRLMCGDSTNEEDVQKLVGGGSIDLLLTDPPYNVDYEGKVEQLKRCGYCFEDKDRHIANDNMEEDAFFEFIRKAFSNAYHVMREGACFYVWHSTFLNYAKIFVEALEQSGLTPRQPIIWVKNAFVIGRQDYQWKHEQATYGWKEGTAHYFIDARSLATVNDTDYSEKSNEELIEIIKQLHESSDIQYENKPQRSAEHPTMKPVNLMAKLIRNSSLKGWNVLDLFGGSGSTLMACEQMDRNCYMMEYDEKYCDVIINRWEEATGEKAVKVN